jgi:D-3-phosphoglycerate dehydrogenase
MHRLKVLYLPDESTDPFWIDNLVEQLGDRHDLSILDKDKPLAPQFQGMDVVLDFGGSVGTREMMDAATDARLWQIIGTGLDHVDVEYLKSKDFIVTNCPGRLSGVALAECAMMFMGMLVRQYKRSEQYFRDKKLYMPTVGDLEEATLLIVGMGGSGQALAKRAQAFDMCVWAIDARPIDQGLLDQLGIEFIGTPDDLDRLLPQCDFLSLHVPLDNNTRHLIDDRRIALMKKTACLINVARGQLVDESALHVALLEGRLGGAGLDVFTNEPEEADKPVYQLPNVVVSPHIAGETYGTVRKRNGAVVENIDRLADGREVVYHIDGPAR